MFVLLHLTLNIIVRITIINIEFVTSKFNSTGSTVGFRPLRILPKKFTAFLFTLRSKFFYTLTQVKFWHSWEQTLVLWYNRIISRWTYPYSSSSSDWSKQLIVMSPKWLLTYCRKFQLLWFLSFWQFVTRPIKPLLSFDLKCFDLKPTNLGGT